MTVRWLYWFSLSPQFSSRFQCVRRNPWVQGLLREVLAELLGTFWLMFIGMCGNAQFIIAAGGSWAGFLDQAWAWALGLTFAIYMAGGISGAHLNPAVTLAMATHRGFEWYKVLPYCGGQFIGALLASALTYCVFFDAIAWKEAVGSDEFYTDATAGIFCTIPNVWLTTRGAIVDNLIGTAALLLGLSAISDVKNFNPVAANLAPLMIGMLLFSIILALGSNAGAAINPVRDFPQRVFLSFSGWGPGVFGRHENYWWIPLLVPFLGAQLGIITYDLAVAVHHDQANAGFKSTALSGDEDPDLLTADEQDQYDPPAGLVRTSSNVSARTATMQQHETINVNAVGGLDSAAFQTPAGMVHKNVAWLDPSIKESADNTFHRNRKARQSSQQLGSAGGAAAASSSASNYGSVAAPGQQASAINMTESLLPHAPL